jgi:hypothetical protein
MIFEKWAKYPFTAQSRFFKRTNAQSFVAFPVVTAPLFCGRPHVCRLCARPRARGSIRRNFDALPTSSSRSKQAGAGAYDGVCSMRSFLLCDF